MNQYMLLFYFVNIFVLFSSLPHPLENRSRGFSDCMQFSPLTVPISDSKLAC